MKPNERQSPDRVKDLSQISTLEVYLSSPRRTAITLERIKKEQTEFPHQRSTIH
jgi:hypothetical protein